MMWNKRATCAAGRIVSAFCLKVMGFEEIETVVWNPYFKVSLSGVRNDRSAQYRVQPLSTALILPNGLDAMRHDCGSLSYCEVTRASFNIPDLEWALVFLTIHFRNYFKIYRSHFSKSLPPICSFESACLLFETKTAVVASGLGILLPDREEMLWMQAATNAWQSLTSPSLTSIELMLLSVSSCQRGPASPQCEAAVYFNWRCKF